MNLDRSTETAISACLHAAEGLSVAGQMLYFDRIRSIAETNEPLLENLEVALSDLDAADFEPDHQPLVDAVIAASTEILNGMQGWTELNNDERSMWSAFRLTRHLYVAYETLFPFIYSNHQISTFFQEPHLRDGLSKDLPSLDNPDLGLSHHSNDKDARGGHSLYVPERVSNTEELPVIVALHGGSGHGRTFVWNWIRVARSRNCVLVSPTSQDRTWSLFDIDHDTPAINKMLDEVASRVSINRNKLLLTGMSDGGTFSYLSGLQSDSNFTHLAPCSASFHPFLLDVADPSRIKDLPIYIVHGELDWMFPSSVAWEAKEALDYAGAKVHLQVIDYLAHTICLEAHSAVADWFLASA